MMSFIRFEVVLFLLLVNFVSVGQGQDTLESFVGHGQDTLQSLKEEVWLAGGTTFSFFGLRSGITNVEVFEFLKFEKTYLEKLERSDNFHYFATWGIVKEGQTITLGPNRKVGYDVKLSGNLKSTNGVIGYLHRTIGISLKELHLYFTADKLLWKLDAVFEIEDYMSDNCSLQQLAKSGALQSVFPEAEVSMIGEDSVGLSLRDQKVAVDAILKAQSQYIEDFKKASAISP